MDHQDILDLISAGDFGAAGILLAIRRGRNGVSGHDAQIIQAAEKKARARLAAEAPVVEPVHEPVEKKVAKRAKPPSKTPRRTRRRKEK